MNNPTKKLIIALAIIVAIATMSVFAFRNFMKKTPAEAKVAAKEENVAAKTNSEKAPEITAEASKLYQPIKGDIIFGDVNAPVTVIEYASLSCPHCATFHSEGFPKLKAEYIDYGKVKFIHRDFPLNQPALVAAMLAECVAQDNKDNQVTKYYDFIKALFKTQDNWAFQSDFVEKLKSIAKLDGMSSERFDLCVKDKNLQEKILKSRLEVAKVLQLQSTPTFFVNGEDINGYSGYDEIKKAIEKKLTSEAK